MPESYFQWSERQAEQERRDERMAREDRFRDPGPTRYALKSGRWYFETLLLGDGPIQPTARWSEKSDHACKFASATEASLFAVEHNITGVEIVAV